MSGNRWSTWGCKRDAFPFYELLGKKKSTTVIIRKYGKGRDGGGKDERTAGRASPCMHALPLLVGWDCFAKAGLREHWCLMQTYL